MADATQKLTLDLKASQTLIMTPQLREAIGLLQLNNQELAGYLEAELANNPFLERDEKNTDPDGDEPNPTSPEPDSQEDIPEGFDTGSDMAQIGSGGNGKFTDDLRSLEETVSTKPSLRDHLMQQAAISLRDPAELMIAGLLIDRLDEAGYFREDTNFVAKQLGCKENLINYLIEKLLRFDPAGIFARNLQECLKLQLIDSEAYTPAFGVLLDNLDLLAKAEWKALQRLTGCDLEILQEMIQEIKRLNPKPAAEFDHSIAQTALPDVLMRPLPKHEGGGYRVELNQATLPRVLINQEYVALVGQGKATKREEKSYLQDRLQAANWLIRALDQRAQTILKVASAITEAQDGFFLYGVSFLKPLTLREIAEVTDVHESTVSRVTMGKFIGTPRGLFELKYFFDSGISSEDGTSHAAEAIKSRIKSMIDQESAQNILSDDAIAESLQKDGIPIARRTVAKYREAINIPTSSIRRRQKRL